MSCKTTADTLRVSSCRNDDRLRSEYKAELDSKYSGSDCATRDYIHKYDAESTKLRASVRERLWRKLSQCAQTDIVKGMMSSIFLAAIFRVSHVYCIRVVKIMSQHQFVLLLGELDKCAPAGRTLGIMHLANPRPYLSSEEDIVVIIQAADALVSNGHKPVTLHGNYVYRHAKALCDELHFCRLK